MKKFKVDFRGREIGAIGIHHRFVVKVKAQDKNAAIFSLYQKYEHISVTSVEEI